ncbi:glycosyltransferase [Paenibacillus sp. MBLB4367]|uniref:glycosyltransferase n=1 Tax=Paenibacillus sp. MBLB4367 TaxID=3384767 RepID=UPI003907FFE4
MNTNRPSTSLRLSRKMNRVLLYVPRVSVPVVLLPPDDEKKAKPAASSRRSVTPRNRMAATLRRKPANTAGPEAKKEAEPGAASEAPASAAGRKAPSEALASAAGRKAPSEMPASAAGRKASSEAPSSAAGRKAPSESPASAAGRKAPSEAPASAAGRKASSEMPASAAGRKASSEALSSAAGRKAPSEAPASAAGRKAPSEALASAAGRKAPSKPAVERRRRIESPASGKGRLEPLEWPNDRATQSVPLAWSSGRNPKAEGTATVSSRKQQGGVSAGSRSSGTRKPSGGANDAWQEHLEQIMTQVPHKGIVLIPPTTDWRAPQLQRVHHLAQAFARADYLTFFMTPNDRYDRYAEGFHRIGSHLYVSNIPMRAFRRLNKPIMFFNHPTIGHGIMKLNNPDVIYDFRDYPGEVLSGGNIDAYTEHAHRFLLGGASLVLASDDQLLWKARQKRPDTVYCPDGIDYPFFSRVTYRQGLVPDDISAIVFSGRPVIGYFGGFASWCDYEMLQHAADARPKYQFVLIGPDMDGKLQETELIKRPNVTYLGAKPYEELTNYLPFFDVGTIPFRINESTITAFPLKMYEYMAAGRPVVTTDLPKCAQHPYVHAAKQPGQFAVQLDEALRLTADSRYSAKLREYAKSHSWDTRAAYMIEMLRRSGRLSLIR